jgi:transposase-like protein
LKKIITCPYCVSSKISKHGIQHGKPNYYCNNADCKHKIFYADYKYKGCDQKIRAKVLAMSADGNGTRAISRLENVHRDTVISI